VRARVQSWMKIGLPRTPLQHLHTLACIHSKLGENRLDLLERSRIMIVIPVLATRLMPGCRTLQGGRRFPTTWSPSQRTSTSATSSAWRTSRYAACVHCLICCPAWPECVLSTERSLLHGLSNQLEHARSSAALSVSSLPILLANSALPLMVAARRVFRTRGGWDPCTKAPGPRVDVALHFRTQNGTISIFFS